MGRKAVKIVEENIVEDITEDGVTTTRTTQRKSTTMLSMPGMIREALTNGLVTGLIHLRKFSKKGRTKPKKD
jgi:hypothetical protein